MVLKHLLSGGRVRREIAVGLHGAVWAYRSSGGRSDVPEMRFLDSFDLDGRVAVDVGAHAGNWALNLARRVGPSGLVLAYEALPHYGRALSLSIRLLRVRNIRVRAIAVGERDGKTALRWRSEDNELLTGRTHIQPGENASSSVAEVKMATLDHDLSSQGIQPSDVGFVKIDVEGAEVQVLRGAANILRVGHPAVYLEVEPPWLERMGHSAADIFETMKYHGYRPFLVSNSDLIPTNIDTYMAQYADGRAYNNVLFLPAGN